MRELVAGIDCTLVDLRGQRQTRPELYDPDDYKIPQDFGVGLRWPVSGEGENGMVYESVRRQGGTNVCVIAPRSSSFLSIRLIIMSTDGMPQEG
jgi:hypothetical protein